MATARAAALHALVALERGRVDRVREGLDAARLEGREQAFAYELAHGVLRRERLLDFVVESLAHRGLPRDPALRAALRLGAYQLLFVAGMPAHAAVHETVHLVRNNKGFANALLRRLTTCIQARAADRGAVTTELALSDERTFVLPAALPADEALRLALVHSLPDFAVQRWLTAFGTDAARGICEAAGAVPAVFLRAVGEDRDKLREELAAAGVECGDAAHPRLLQWTGGGSPFATKAFRRGGFVVQDPTALAAAEAVPCGPGDTVVDLCAAPGTKTSLLAEKVRPGGRVFAWDPDPLRRQRIGENVARLGLQDVVTVMTDPTALPVADAVLADVPCSNTGVLGRRVEVRRRLEPGTAAAMAATQLGILRRALELARPGGSVVYSTCSIEAEENDGVIDAALAGAARCELAAKHLTLPAAGLHDGGFFAALRRS